MVYLSVMICDRLSGPVRIALRWPLGISSKGSVSDKEVETMKNTCRKFSKGITLIELMIVLVIVAILLGL
ncbi:MAG: prepilin-type N-terminal cleavage/methylation domain-containing protein, partial [Gammaproteobacteria bacterium]|nr:prepilin-type N-terminal cleavage/methylation domain-containing protein [Gammaproteobacteria bacterium]